MLPKYGIVKWRDASGAGPKGMKRMDRLTKNLPHREALGWLFQDSEGTIIVIHERIVSENAQKYVEFTLIPKSWLVEVIPLEEAKKDGSGA